MRRGLILAVCCAMLCGTMLAQGANQREKLKSTTKTQGDFNLANRFTVEIDGVVQPGTYTSAELESLKTSPAARTRSAGPGTVVLTHEAAAESLQWYKSTVDGKVSRKSISVIFHNDAGEEAGRATLINASPRRWSAPDMNAKNSGHAVEKIEISYERMEWK